MLLIIAGYFVILSIIPKVIKKYTTIRPYEITRSCMNIQAVNDIVHVSILTAMGLSGDSTMIQLIPTCTFVYFCFDILFHYKVFVRNKLYLIHHLASCVNIILINTRVELLYALSILLWIQECALIPIAIADIYKMQARAVPTSILIIRPLCYLITRVYTYDYVVHNYWFAFTKPILFFVTSLIMHNVYIFRKQVQAAIRSI